MTAAQARGRSTWTIASCLALGVYALVVLGSSAAAAETRAATEGQPAPTPRGWSWIAQRSQAPSIAALSGVPAEDQAVGWAGQPEMITFLGLAVPRGTQVDTAQLIAHIDEGASNTNAPAAALQACVIISPWAPAPSMAWDTKPLTSCTDAAPGTSASGGTSYAFDLTTLARELGAASGAVYGISIEPASSSTQPFQVALRAIDVTVIPHSAVGPVVGIPSPAPAPSSGARLGTTTVLPALTAPGPAVAESPPTQPAIAAPLPAGSAATESVSRVTGNALTPNTQTVNLNAAYAMLALLGGMPVLAQLARAGTEGPS